MGRYTQQAKTLAGRAVGPGGRRHVTGETSTRGRQISSGFRTIAKQVVSALGFGGGASGSGVRRYTQNCRGPTSRTLGLYTARGPEVAPGRPRRIRRARTDSNMASGRPRDGERGRASVSAAGHRAMAERNEPGGACPGARLRQPEHSPGGDVPQDRFDWSGHAERKGAGINRGSKHITTIGRKLHLWAWSRGGQRSEHGIEADPRTRRGLAPRGRALPRGATRRRDALPEVNGSARKAMAILLPRVKIRSGSRRARGHSRSLRSSPTSRGKPPKATMASFWRSRGAHSRRRADTLTTHVRSTSGLSRRRSYAQLGNPNAGWRGSGRCESGFGCYLGTPEIVLARSGEPESPRAARCAAEELPEPSMEAATG